MGSGSTSINVDERSALNGVAGVKVVSSGPRQDGGVVPCNIVAWVFRHIPQVALDVQNFATWPLAKQWKQRRASLSFPTLSSGSVEWGRRPYDVSLCKYHNLPLVHSWAGCCCKLDLPQLPSRRVGESFSSLECLSTYGATF